VIGCFLLFGGDMRLDKYLKVSRLIKRRTVANDACDGEHISVNGKTAKASYQVKCGDVIAITYGEKTVKVKVTDIKDSTKKADAIEMYEIVEG
jgi:ribosomal 50S subunit-recycling heat shock protein